jgi:hypothetical protein
MRLLIMVAGILWTSYVLARFLNRRGFSAVARPLEVVGANWIGVSFLIFVCLLGTDLVTGFGLLLPRMAPALRGWALVASLALCEIAVVQARRAPVVRSYEVQLAHLPRESDGTVLVLATDLHLDRLLGGRWLAERVAQIQAERPDLVIFGGDILEGHHEAHREFLPLVRRLSPPLGLWAVTGNHEFYGGFDESVRMLQEAGFRVLRDQWAEVRPGLLIAGVDDLTARRRYGQDGNFVGRAGKAGTPFSRKRSRYRPGTRSDGIASADLGGGYRPELFSWRSHSRPSLPAAAGRQSIPPPRLRLESSLCSPAQQSCRQQQSAQASAAFG